MHNFERRVAKLEPRPTPPNCHVLFGGPDDFEAMDREAAELEAEGVTVMQIRLVPGVKRERT